MPYTILLLQYQLSKQMRNTCMVDSFLKAIRSSCTQFSYLFIFNIVNSKVNICTYTVIWFPLLMKVNCTKTREITALKSASHLQETINYI